jgi:hypothetical protein
VTQAEIPRTTAKSTAVRNVRCDFFAEAFDDDFVVVFVLPTCTGNGKHTNEREALVYLSVRNAREGERNVSMLAPSTVDDRDRRDGKNITIRRHEHERTALATVTPKNANN